MGQLLCGVGYHLLLDRAENRMPLRVVHLDADAVAVVQEWRLRRTVQDGFNRANFGDARVADPPLSDRLAWPAVRIAVRHRAGTDDHARAERAGLSGMRNERRKV